MRILDAAKTRAYLKQMDTQRRGALAFAHLDDQGDVSYDWHSHPHHQLIYSIEGSGRVEVDGKLYFLPPQRAAWISACTHHRTTLLNSVTASIFLHPRLVRFKTEPIHILAAPPLLREMMRYASIWPVKSNSREPLRASFFRTFVLLCREWLKNPTPFWLPSTTHPQLARALDYTLANLSTVTLESAAACAAMSTRSFRRHVSQALSMPFSDYLFKARMLKAMELLALPGARASSVAPQVGYLSDSAFSTAFQSFTAETPSRYRTRLAISENTR